MVWGAFGWPEAEEPQKQPSADSAEADYPECDYDQDLTPLYEAIEERAWIAVNQFLHSGYWPESLFPDKMSPEEQARTWVTRYETRPDGSKKVRWSQLPIHAAVIFGAPSVIIQQLVECFPQSVRCTDDHRMLPLHLAFRHGSDDSVLALFLEEFPEAVNVRGYKGRLPVECAKKGPNPERGAIIQTILQKNQSAWERKKSAVQLKELYCVKEALKIKSQKVSHLETAMREIKSREHKTRKELAATMTELKVIKSKKGEPNDQQESLKDKEAVRLLVEKLAALESATKDLVEKELKTKDNLKKTLIELETLKKLKPTEEQAKQFAKLEQVASTEVDMLQRDPENAIEPSSKAPEAEKSDTSKEEPVQTEDPTASIIEAPRKSPNEAQAEEKKEEPASETHEHKKKGPSVMKLLGMKKAAAKKASEEKAAPAKQEKDPAVINEPVETPVALVQKLAHSASREEEKKKLRKVEKTNKGLTEKIAKLEEAMKQFEEKASKKKHEMDLISCPDEDTKEKKLSKKQEKKFKALEAEMAKLRESANATKKELGIALSQLEQLKDADKVKAVKVTEDNAKCKKLEKKISVLKLALKQFEEKSSLAKKEMDSIKSALKTGIKLTPTQKKQMALLEAAMIKLDNNAQATKKELDSTVDELVELKAQIKADGSLKSGALTKQMMEDIKKELKKELKEEMKIAAKAEGSKKIQLVEETNKQLEEKIKQLEETMKQFEDKASKTRQDMDQALNELKKMPDIEQEDKRHEKQVDSLKAAMKHLEDTAGKTQTQLDSALKELAKLKAKEKKSSLNRAANAEADNKALTELSKKVAALQSAMVGFEVKETRTVQELEKTMKELEEVSKKRFEVLSATAEHTQSLVSDSHFTKEVQRLDRKATKEEEKIAKLEAIISEITSKSGSTKNELDRTLKILEEVRSSSEFKNIEESKQDKKIIKELTKKVASLQSAVLGFELKEGKTMKELENTMKQLEELTSKRFEMLEQAAAGQGFTSEAQAESKVHELQAMMKELEATSAATKEELEQTKKDLEAMKAMEINPKGANQEIVEKQEQQIKELNEKITVLQSAVMGFEVKETKTMQELEQTMKQLEELTAKRFEVLQKVAGREIEAAKAAEATKYSQKAAKEEKKVAALEFAMRELESKAYKTKLELEKTMKNLEMLEERQNAKQEEGAGITGEEKRIMRELVDKVADIQEAVIAYDEKENKTDKELEATKKELEATKKQVEALRSKQHGLSAKLSDAESFKVVPNGDDDTVELEENGSNHENQEAAETAKRVTEETLTSLEKAIHHLVEKLGDEEGDDSTESLKSIPDELKLLMSKSGSLLTAPSVSPAQEEGAKSSEQRESSEDEARDESEDKPKQPATTPAPAVTKNMKKSSSLFGRLSKKANKSKKRKSFSIFGRSSSKKNTDTKSPQSPATKTIQKTTVAPTTKTAPAAPAETPAPQPTATEEQRKEVAALHGPEIAAVLSDQQILAILSKGQSKQKEQQEELAAVKSYESIKNRSAQEGSASVPSTPHKAAGTQDPPSSSLIAANTYDDGFEIKF